MVVLKNIPRILSPQLLSVMARMGHGDRIVLGDANFPHASNCKEGAELVRADGHGIPELLKAILTLLPLDSYSTHPVSVMAVVPGDKAKGMKDPPIWAEYRAIVKEAEGKEMPFEEVERFEFYTQARKCYSIVATGESALYGNIILTKGVL